MKLTSLLVGLALALIATPVAAQSLPNVPPYAVTGKTYNAVAVTASSSRTALTATSAYPAITINNYGAKDVFVALGNGSVVATTSSIPVRAGKHITLFQGAATNIAAICGGADTSTIDIYQATGPVNLGP